jgi:MurNAc alpha-1-phosphate uridylyltransferase
MIGKIKRAMVLAAGKGKRLGELTRKTPKPLVDLGGTTPLFRIIKGLEKAGVEEIVINCHWRAEKIIDTIELWRSKGAFKAKVILSYEEDLLETAGGIKKAIGYFKDEPFLLVNGDIVWGEGFSEFVMEISDHYDAEKMDFLLALTPVDHDRKDNGDFRFYKDGRLDFLDEKEVSGISYCGLSVIHTRVFDALDEGYNPLVQVWRQAITEKTFYGFKGDYPWIDMGTPEGLLKAKDIIKYENGLPGKVIQFGA